MVLLGPLFLFNTLWGLGLPPQFPLLGPITVVAQLCSWLGQAVLVHLWVSYPSGHVRRRGDRLLVRVAYGYALISVAIWLPSTSASVIIISL